MNWCLEAEGESLVESTAPLPYVLTVELRSPHTTGGQEMVSALWTSTDLDEALRWRSLLPAGLRRRTLVVGNAPDGHNSYSKTRALSRLSDNGSGREGIPDEPTPSESAVPCDGMKSNPSIAKEPPHQRCRSVMARRFRKFDTESSGCCLQQRGRRPWSAPHGDRTRNCADKSYYVTLTSVYTVPQRLSFAVAVQTMCAPDGAEGPHRGCCCRTESYAISLPWCGTCVSKAGCRGCR